MKYNVNFCLYPTPVSLLFSEEISDKRLLYILGNFFLCTYGLQINYSFSRGSWTWTSLDFPGGAEDKNLPASAGDLGSIPGPGRFYMPRNNIACASQLLKPRIQRLCSATREATPMRNTCTTAKSSPHLLKLEKAQTKQWRYIVAKKSKWINSQIKHIFQKFKIIKPLYYTLYYVQEN